MDDEYIEFHARLPNDAKLLDVKEARDASKSGNAIRLVPAIEAHKDDVVKLLEALLEDARAGRMKTCIVGSYIDNKLDVSWAGKPSELLAPAARILYVINSRLDRYVEDES